MEKPIMVGLKTNSAFLFALTKGENLGGLTGGIYHRSVIIFNNSQFDNFKLIIKKLGYSVEKSLVKDTMTDCDFSCYLRK